RPADEASHTFVPHVHELGASGGLGGRGTRFNALGCNVRTLTGRPVLSLASSSRRRSGCKFLERGGEISFQALAGCRRPPRRPPAVEVRARRRQLGWRG